MTFAIHDLLTELSVDRPIFHSEADFQLAVFRLVSKKMPYQVHLEAAYPTNRRTRMDLWLPREGVAIELKYFTTKLAVCRDGERFGLKEHAATDLARYGFFVDVQRLEHLVQDGTQPGHTGFAVLLTNSPTLWDRRRTLSNTNDAAFHVYEGRSATGKLHWSKHGVPIKEGAVDLRGHYTMRWRHYSGLDRVAGEFRYLVATTTSQR